MRSNIHLTTASDAMQEIGNAEILGASVSLPNGKALVRIDYQKTGLPVQQLSYP